MTGLVLEGGAMRGLFTAGVIDVMMERGIEFDGIVGVSAGAAFGCNYKSRQIGRVIRYNKLMAHNWRFCSFRSWVATGDLIGAKFAYETLPNEIDVFDRATYNANPTNFYAVCTDVVSGEAVYQEVNTITDETMNWIRASASMPLFSRIVDIDGHRLLDGGVADSIPLEWMERQGYDRNVVILTQPQGFVKKPNALTPVMSLVYRKYPRFVEAMRRRHDMYNAELAYIAHAEQDGRAIVIRPPQTLPIGHICHDPAQMQQIYEIGRQTALAAPRLHF